MKKKLIRNLVLTGVFFALFLIFTVVIFAVDVQPIGPQGSRVGLATLNKAVFEATGTNMIWYEITDILGYISLLLAACFGALGIYQLIKRKSLLKVDHRILLLGAFYVLVIGAYLIFELVSLNYRPILIDGELEASYPSSHTMIVTCIMITAMMVLHTIIPKKKAVLIASDVFCILFTAVTLIGRFLSGVHWFTDIIAGLLLSLALIYLYRSSVIFTDIKINSSKNETLDEGE